MVGVLLFTLAGLNFEAIAASSDSIRECVAGPKLVVESIEIVGNHRTQSKVILNELGFQANQEICQEQISEGLAQLQSMGLFSSVAVDRTDLASDRVSLVVRLEEKWTTIPIFKINSGGGVTQYTLGVYDPNVFGSFKEAGVQYENLAGNDSGVIWMKNPRLFDRRQGIDAQYWNTRRIRLKYDQTTEGAEIKSGFLQQRQRAYLEYFREVRKNLVLKISADYNDDKFSTENLPDEVIRKIESGVAIPPSTKVLLARVGADYGKIRGETHLLEGKLLSVSFGHASPMQRDLSPFLQTDLNFVYYLPLSHRLQFAQRILAGGSSTDILQFWYYLGGLDRIRGFSDNRFAARHFSLSNSEIRYVMKQKPSYIVQGTSFVDLIGSGEEVAEVVRLDAASVGAGVRVILPKFYRLVLRLDYAKPVIKTDPTNWSFGVQQFF